jgi:hypothetical protein
MGVSGIQVEEVFSLDESSLDKLKYGVEITKKPENVTCTKVLIAYYLHQANLRLDISVQVARRSILYATSRQPE